jgi:hypothetical protein
MTYSYAMKQCGTALTHKRTVLNPISHNIPISPFSIKKLQQGTVTFSPSPPSPSCASKVVNRFLAPLIFDVGIMDTFTISSVLFGCGSGFQGYLVGWTGLSRGSDWMYVPWEVIRSMRPGWRVDVMSGGLLVLVDAVETHNDVARVRVTILLYISIILQKASSREGTRTGFPESSPGRTYARVRRSHSPCRAPLPSSPFTISLSSRTLHPTLPPP